MKYLQLLLALLLTAAAHATDSIPKPRADSSLMMAVEDVYDVPRRGLAINSKISTGKVWPGKLVRIVGVSERIKTLQVTEVNRGGANVAQAGPDDYVGLIFASGLTKEEVSRGMVICDTGFGKLETIITLKIKMNRSGFTSFTNGSFTTLYLHGQYFPNTEWVLPPGVTIRPGTEREVKMILPVPLAIIPNLQVAVMDGQYRAIGNGKILVRE